MVIETLIEKEIDRIRREPDGSNSVILEQEMRKLYQFVRLSASPIAPRAWNYHSVAGQPLVWIFSGCYWFDAKGGCGPCDGYGKHANINLEKAIEEALQFHTEHAQQRFAEDVSTYTINIGSATTFNDNYFSPQARKKLFEGVNQIAQQFISAGKKVFYVFETRLRDINERGLEELRMYIDPRMPIEIGTGVESSIDWIREILVNKGYGKNVSQRFRSLIDLGRKYSVTYEAHALLGVPGLNEIEAIANAVVTTKELLDVGVQRVVLMTTNIKQGASLGTHLYNNGLFSPVSLHATVETIKFLNAIGYANFLPFGFAASDPTLAYAQACTDCTPRIMQAIDTYGRHALHNPEAAAAYFSSTELGCDCKQDWQTSIELQSRERPLHEKILPTVQQWKSALYRAN